jgi:hypothetical protein
MSDAPQVTVTFVLDGERHEYDVDALSVSEYAAAAIRYLNLRSRDYAEYEDFRAAQDEANRFANFCIAETVDESGEWCDPSRSFRDLWERFVTEAR